MKKKKEKKKCVNLVVFAHVQKHLVSSVNI